MLEHGIEWEQKGEHKEHLSVLEFKRETQREAKKSIADMKAKNESLGQSLQ